MFKHRWLSALAVSTDLDWDVRGLLLAIAERFMRPDGMNVWASQETIAVECGGNRSKKKAVQRMLREAQDAGWVTYEVRPDGHGVDRLHLTPILPDSGSEATPESGSTSTLESSAEATPESGSEPRRVNPGEVEHVVAAVADGPERGVGEPPEVVLAGLRLAAGRGEQVPRSLAPYLEPFCVPEMFPADIDAITGVKRAADFLLVLDAVVFTADQRLPVGMMFSARMAAMATRDLLHEAERVGWGEWEALMFRGETWRRAKRVNAPVQFVVGCISGEVRDQRAKVGRYALDR